MRDTPRNDDTESSIEQLIDPLSLHDDPNVPVIEKTRMFEPGSFENLQKRYDALAGVSQVGIRDSDGRVLLIGDEENVSPLGSEVLSGEDWITVTEQAMEDRTGQRVRIDHPILLEDSQFCREGDEGDCFPATSVHFEASLPDPSPEFLDMPAVPDEYEHPFYPDESPVLEWHSTVPEHVPPNHESHVERYLNR